MPRNSTCLSPSLGFVQSCVVHLVPTEGASEVAECCEMDLVFPDYPAVPGRHQHAVGPACVGPLATAACQSPESRPWGGPSLPKANRPPGKFCSGSHPPLGGCQFSCQKPQALQSCPETRPRGLVKGCLPSTSWIHSPWGRAGGLGRAAAATAMVRPFWAGRS